MEINEEKNSKNHWRTLRTLGSHLWPKKRADLKLRVILALLFLASAKVLNVYVPFLFKMTIDQLEVKEQALMLPVALIVSFGLAKVMVAVFGEVRDLIFVRVAQNAQRTIALQTFKHLHGLSLDFHLSRQTGGLSRVIERGTRGIQFVLNFMTFNIVPTFLEIFLVAGVLVYYFNATYALIVCGTIVLYVLATLAVTEWRLKFRRSMNQSESKANTKAIDSLINFETVKYFGNEEHEYKRFDQFLARYEVAAIKSQRSLSILNVIQSLIVGVGQIAVLLMAGQAVIDGRHSLGDFVLVSTYLIQLYMPLNFLGFVYREIKNSLVDMDKMFELVHVNASVENKVGAVTYKPQGKEIRFKNVSFSYNEDRQILDGVDITIQGGETVAVVGPSGSGKSTLARLLFRFYDVSSGEILLDGSDLRGLSQESVRENIGVVPQDTVLFNDTIGYNIGYGNPGASIEEIIEAAKMAKIHEFIATLPQGYETPVGERGLKLSGGEKQRVAIARTILKNPPIMIFDEATSALDSNKEKEIQDSLRELSKNRSTLVIAHRLSTIIDADQIIVLKEGRVIERGRHDELIRKNGEYAEMWSRQQEAQSYEEKLKNIKS